MAGKTNYLENKILDSLFNIITPHYTVLTGHLALGTNATTLDAEAGTFTEVGAGIGYTRIALSNTQASAASAGIIKNNLSSITFGPATSNWGTIAYVAVFDAASGGNMLYSGTVAATPVNTGQSYVFNTDALTVNED